MCGFWRFQLRAGLPVQFLDGQDEDDGSIDRELNEEAAWIFAKALSAKTVSSQVLMYRVIPQAIQWNFIH